MVIPPRTGHERLKRQVARWRWVAFGAAIVIHAAVLFLTPSFAISSGGRMVVALGPWAPPTTEFAPGFVSLDTSYHRPLLINEPDVNHRVPRLYPWIMWHFREPSSAHVQVTLTRSGRVRNVVLLDSSDNGGDDAIVELVQLMRFGPGELPAGVRGVVGTIEIAVVEPR